jgi:hypothetical protein
MFSLVDTTALTIEGGIISFGQETGGETSTLSDLPDLADNFNASENETDVANIAASSLILK